MRQLLQEAMRIAGSPVAALKRPDGIRPAISRGKLRKMIPADALEIGPFDVPFLTGPNVRYFDILDQAHLRQRAAELSRDPDGCPFIHYTGKLSDIDRRFAAVFSAHAVEHMPDLATHLTDVARLLEPGGSYFLIIPDKRYCFDHFRPLTTFEDVLDGRGRDRPSIQAVTDQFRRTTHNQAVLHWLGVHGRIRGPGATIPEIEAAGSGEYVDVHQWVFTPESFQSIVDELRIFPSVTVYDTPFGDLEFAAELKLEGWATL